MKHPKPPAELGPHGKRLWRQLTCEYPLEDTGGQAHLLTACRSEDDIQRMRAIVAKEGDVCATDKSRAHPLLAAIARAEATRRQSLRCLNLDIGEANPVGRPPQ